jgi:rRNA processing protein Gar1
MSKVIGKVAQIIGPVVDVVFNGKMLNFQNL